MLFFKEMILMLYSFCPVMLIPLLDPSIRKTSGILPKCHTICIELN